MGTPGPATHYAGISSYRGCEVVSCRRHEEEKEALLSAETESSPGEIRIDLSPDDPRTSPPLPPTPISKFPKEPHKLAVALGSMALAGASNDIVLAWVHERVGREPLPDLAFSHLPYIPFALEVSEYIILSFTSAVFLLCLCHKHRWIVFRRLFFIASLLYFGRCVTMASTQLPVADVNYYCAPKMNRTSLSAIVMRGLSVLSGLGMTMAGKHTLCGDYVYSGHTIILVLGYCHIAEYSPRRWWPVHWAFWLGALAGILSLLLSRGHYLLDCILSYYITTRLFWLYHTMANHPALKEASATNHLSRVWWWRFFRWMEGGVDGAVPRRFESPIPWPPTRLFRPLSTRLAPTKHNQH